MGKIWSSGSAANKSAAAEDPTRAAPNLNNPRQGAREVEARLQHLRQRESLGQGLSLPPQRLVAPTRASVAQQYQAAGALQEDMDLTLAGDWYLVGDGLKVQFEAAWLRQQVQGAALDGLRARVQLQAAF